MAGYEDLSDFAERECGRQSSEQSGGRRYSDRVTSGYCPVCHGSGKIIYRRRTPGVDPIREVDGSAIELRGGTRACECVRGAKRLVACVKMPKSEWRGVDLQRRPPPLREGDSLVGQTCPGCGKPLKAGDVPTLVTIGPGDDEDARRRAREGRAYNAVAVVAHDQCVNG